MLVGDKLSGSNVGTSSGASVGVDVGADVAGESNGRKSKLRYWFQSFNRELKVEINNY